MIRVATLFVAAWWGAAALATNFEPGYGDAGLSRLRLNGTELLAPFPPGVATIRLGAPGRLREGEREVTQTFDADARTTRLTYAWGEIRLNYKEADGRFEIECAIENRAPDPIAECTVNLFHFKLPRLPDDSRWQRKFEIATDNHDEIPWLLADWKDAGFVFALDTLDPPARIAFATPDAEGVRRAQGRRALWRSPEDPVIAPGETRTFRVSFRPLVSGKPPEAVIEDLIADFRRKFPRIVQWPDRRMIGMLAIASNAHRSEKNPSGWLNDAALDVKNSKLFRRKMLAQADTAVRNLKNANAQGMIFWSPEGERIPRLSYIGDPRLIKLLSPDMDAVADEFFARFTRAGLRAGVCVRPSRLDTAPADEAEWQHDLMNFDVAAELSSKIDYARQRWGCTIFYIDTNTHYYYRHDGSLAGRPFDAAILRTLAEKYPDILIVPEIPTTAYYAYSVPYRELREHAFGGHAATSPLVRSVWPEAFSLINPIDGPIEERKEELIRSAAAGNILLFRCWFADTANPLLQRIYQEGATEN